jgi:hypothetical protein
VKLNVRDACSLESSFGFAQGNFSGFVNENLSFVLKEMGDGK